MSKKQFEVLASNPEALQRVKGFYDDKHPERRPMMLDRYGRAIIKDSGIAGEIRSRFGAKKYGGSGEVTVVPVNKPGEEGHNYIFRMPGIPGHSARGRCLNRFCEECNARENSNAEDASEEKDVDAVHTTKPSG